MTLRIETQPALIGIQNRPAILEIQQPMADMDIHTEQPMLQIQAEPAALYIDQSQCFAEAGLKKIFDLLRDYAALGKRKAHEGTTKTVRQGRQLMDIHKGKGAIVQQAKENGFQSDAAALTIAMVPKSRPRIEVVKGEINAELVRGKVDVNIKTNAPRIHFQQRDVNVYLKQKNSIRIQYVGEQLNVTG